MLRRCRFTRNEFPLAFVKIHGLTQVVLESFSAQRAKNSAWTIRHRLFGYSRRRRMLIIGQPG
jgi:hypothetical protein